MNKYITYILEALEDIKLAKTVVQIDSEESMDYITGSSIRGAYIYKYMVKNMVSDINTGEHRDKLLKGGIKFMNAYPVYEDKRTMPFPKCYFAPKQEIRNFDNTNTLKLRLGIDRKLDEGYEKIRMPEFVGFDDNDYQVVNIKKKANLHINKSGEKNILFRYDAIKRGQKFKGIIKAEKQEYVEEIIELLSDDIVYIGGSKGSGYGKCRIDDMQIEEINPECEQFENMYDFDNELYLLALSDIIYRTDLGEYKNYIEPDFIKKAMNLSKVEYVDSCIETKRVTSFNNKWNCSTPQIVAIKAGSVFKYRFEGEISSESLICFMDKGIGERKAEGFGRFVILSSLKDAYLHKDDRINGDSYDFYPVMEKITPEDREQIISIINRVYEQRVNAKINEYVLEMYKSIDHPDKMERSQWGNYLAMFKSLYYEEPSVGKKKYKDYMDHLNAKKSKSYKDLIKLNCGDKKFYEVLKDFVEASDDVDKFYNICEAKRIEIRNINSCIDSKFVYRINMKILIELCRYHLRKESETK